MHYTKGSPVLEHKCSDFHWCYLEGIITGGLLYKAAVEMSKNVNQHKIIMYQNAFYRRSVQENNVRHHQAKDRKGLQRITKKKPTF
jgi:hypothetical protein